MKDFIKKCISYILILIIIILLVPCILNFCISKCSWGIADNETWVLFWATWLGAIMGGCITFVALKKTIQFEREEEQENRRLQVKPYLKFKVEENVQEDKEIKIKGYEENYISYFLTPQNRTSINGEITTDIKKQLIIQNLGINSAIEFNILEVYYDEIKDITRHEISVMQVREKLIVDFNIVLPQSSKEKLGMIPIKIKIAYSDLIESYYEQTIELLCGCNFSYPIDDNNIKYCYCMYLGKVSKSIVHKNKKIEIEKIKRIDKFFKKKKKKEDI